MARNSQVMIRRGEVIPDFTLPDSTARNVSTRDFYMRRNLVLAVLPRNPEPGWSRWAEQLGQAAGWIPDADAAILLVTPPEMDAPLRAAIDQLPASVYTLFDGRDIVRERFGSPGDEGVLIITDRYGVAFVVETGGPTDEQIDPAAIPGWVEFIACQCS